MLIHRLLYWNENKNNPPTQKSKKMWQGRLHVCLCNQMNCMLVFAFLYLIMLLIISIDREHPRMYLYVIVRSHYFNRGFNRDLHNLTDKSLFSEQKLNKINKKKTKTKSWKIEKNCKIKLKNFISTLTYWVLYINSENKFFNFLIFLIFSSFEIFFY